MRGRPTWQSFRDAFRGMAGTLFSGRNIWIEMAVGAAICGFAAWLRVSRGEWAILVLAIGTVLAAETFNTAIEAVVDLLSPQYHDRAKIAKDVAAAAVLMTAVASAIIGFLILGPPLWERLRG